MAIEGDAKPGLFQAMFRRYLAVDLIVGAFLAALWLLIYNPPEPGPAIAIAVCVYVVRFAAWVVHLRAALDPVTRWERTPERFEGTQLRELDALLRGLPARITPTFVVGWVGYFGGLAALGWWVVPELIPIGRAELLAVVLQATAVGVGALMVYLLITRVLVDDAVAELATLAWAGDSSPVRTRTPLRRRLVLVGVGLAGVPVIWYGSMDWLARVELVRESTVLSLQLSLERNARLGTGELELGGAPSFADLDAGTGVQIDTRREHVAVALAHEGSWSVREQDVEFPWLRFSVEYLLFLFVAMSWGALTIVTQAESILRTLGRLSQATQRLVEVGDVRAMARIPVSTDDEVGDVTRDFNALLAMLDALVSAANRVAEGDLAIDIEGRGDLSEAFSRMVGQLHALVSQVRETVTNLASATSEIQAATSDQERAASRQSDEMIELDEGMAMLADAAAQIDGASHGVLANAERTLANADDTTAKMGSLGQQIEGIERLLGQLSEIADRSDLLALNGSLEAIRAGEAGRGFALVATEMRRLAERVTGIVDDVGGLVTAINLANRGTVETTERNRMLAEETAAAARSIAGQTQDQSGETERASVNVREVASILSRTMAAMGQTRAIAESLGAEAQRLERLLESFTLRERG